MTSIPIPVVPLAQRTRSASLASVVTAAILWVACVAIWSSLVLIPQPILEFSSIWIPAISTLIFGGIVGSIPKMLMWVRLICLAGASMLAGVALGVVYISAMLRSPDPNSDIEGAAGLVLVVVPGAIALFLAFGLSFSLGLLVRLVARRSRVLYLNKRRNSGAR